MYNKFKGFTLAEVLITLGIIGVVAALTLPSLIQNYQKQVWVNQLKKTVSVLENGFKKAMADDEVMELENTKLMQSIGNSTLIDETKFDNFIAEFKKYFKVIKAERTYVPTTNLKYLNGSSAGEIEGDFSRITLADGSMLFLQTFKGIPTKTSEAVCKQIKQLGGSSCAMFNYSYFEIDVNGNKAPNQYGRDRFIFFLGNNGVLYPHSGKDYALFNIQEDLSTNPAHWRNDINYLMDNGLGCAARIMENGWKMDY